MERDSFIFYRSWLEAIKNLPREMQGEVLTAIIEYGLNGVTTESLKPITSAMLAMVKPQIDINNKRFENGCQGGRPKKNQTETEEEPNGNQVETKQKPKRNQKVTKKEPNENQSETKAKPNVNDNDNVNANDSSKKEPSNEGKKEGEPDGSTLSPDYLKFKDWMKRHAPYCNDPKNFPHQITEDEFFKLKEKYTGEELATIIEQIENRRDLRKRYTNLYRTVLNWIKPK